jgi:hypothetical protein
MAWRRDSCITSSVLNDQSRSAPGRVGTAYRNSQRVLYDLIYACETKHERDFDAVPVLGGAGGGRHATAGCDFFRFPPVDVIPGSVGSGPAEKRSDPDDVQSIVRFLVYANEFRVEGLVASAGTLANIARKQHILDVLDRYQEVEASLRRHDERYPTATDLRRRTVEGAGGSYGKPAEQILGEGKDSEASRLIIELVERPDPEPLWFCLWGGSQELGQALWRLRNERTPEQVADVVRKIPDLLYRAAGRLREVDYGHVSSNVRDLFSESIRGHAL